MRRMMSIAVALTLCSALGLAEGIGEGPLVPAIVTQNPVEICLNSRYSQHSLRGTASVQQLSNVLWAAGRMPVAGAYRNICAATPAGTFLYDPNSHSLTRHSGEVTGEGAFAIWYEAELAFDAGVMYMPAMLAAVSLCNSTESPMASCPKGLGLPRTRLFFGVQAGNGLTSAAAVHSSVPEGQSGWLPDPATTGNNNLEEVLANLKYVDSFVQANLTLRQVSQILWAGYGCTAHVTTNGRAGLTIPSAFANYYLTGRIYLVKEDGVHRYLNRNPAANTSTKDHRTEPVTIAAVDGRGRPIPPPEPADARIRLQSAVNGLPRAPCYVVLCLEAADAGQEFAQLETGFVAANMLIQASAMGLGCHFKPALTGSEQKSIQTATGIPASHVPQVVVSIGPAGVPVTVAVTVQGDGRPEAGWTIPLTVRFFTPGADVLEDIPIREFRLTTTESAGGDSAVCDVVGIAPGTYDISVFGESTLTNVRRSVAVSPPGTSVDLGTLLEGDANQDGIVDLDDCVILSGSWLSSKEQTPYDSRTDFDRNGFVNAADLSLLAASWLRCSPVEIQP
jgi:hypothetical protein